MTTSISGVWSAVFVNGKTVYQSGATVIDGPVNLFGTAPELHIFSGAVVTGLTSPMSGWASQWGSAFVHSGGTLRDSTLQSIVPFVSSGGVMSRNALNHTGDKISSGATVVDNTKFNGGDLSAGPGARIDNFTLKDGVAFASGTIWSGGTVQSGGVMNATNGTVVQDTLVLQGGQVQIHSGSTAQRVRALGTGLNGPKETIQGSLILNSGGTSLNAQIEGGYMAVQGSGALSRDAYITSNGWQDVGSNNNGASGGGVASSTTLINGGAQFVKGGLAVDTWVSSGGRQVISAGGTAIGGSVFSGGQFQIEGGGTGINNVVLPGGQGNVWGLALASNGTASGLTIQSGGSAVAQSGGRISGSTLFWGAQGVISSSGIMADTVVSAGATARVQSGGTASGLTAMGSGFWNYDAGAILVGAGGTALNGTLSGAYQSVQGQGAFSQNTLITGNGWEDVGWNARDNTYGGGVASGSTLINGGKQFVSGGRAVGTLVSSAGTQTVMSTGIASGSVVATGGVMSVLGGGTSFNAQVAPGGIGTVSQGGTAIAADGVTSGMTVQAGGTAIAQNGGTVDTFTILDGGRATAVSGGTLANSVLSRGAQAYVLSGGVADNVQARGNGALGNTQGSLILSAGGTSFNAQIDGGYMSVQGNGAFSQNALITNNGWQDVGSNNNGAAGGGVASGSTLINGGAQYVQSGTAVNTVVSSGGRQEVRIGGVASGSTVFSGGQTLVAAGGILSGGTIGQGGLLSAASGGVYGGHISAAGIVSGGTVQSEGILEIVSGGTTTGPMVASGGSLQIDPGGKLAGLATLSPGASATLDGNAGGTINLGGSGYARLTLTGTTSPTSIISGFNGDSPTASDQIVLRDVPKSEILGVNFPDDNTIEFVLTGDRVLRMNVPGAGKKPARYDLSNGPGNSTIFSVCFLAGTLIRTPDGERAVETIRPGDLVYVYHNGRQEVQRVAWAGQHCVTCTESAGFEPTRYPVRISAGAFGEGMPYKDLLLTPEHCLFIDGALVPARMLVNGRSIIHDTSLKTYTYHHIETQSHAVVMADGLLCETYLDTGNRDGLVVSTGSEARASAAGIEGAGGTMAAPLNVSRDFVEPIWSRLARRVGVELSGQMQNDVLPCIHLRTEAGDVLHPVRVNEGGCHVFHVPAESAVVHICSPAARPSEAIGPFVDDRRLLGVLVGAMTLYAPDGTSSIDVCRFLQHARGWHDANEPAQRWTNGCGVLPLGSAVGAGKRVLALQILAAAARAEASEALAS